jgi:hypothetical protein
MRRQDKDLFSIQSSIHFLRMTTSAMSQSVAIIQIVSFNSWPLLLVCFLKITSPLLYGFAGMSFLGHTGNCFQETSLM